MLDFTNQEQVVQLLKDCKSDQEWNDTCKAVKKANGGYPSWWYAAVLAPGLPQQAASRWQESGDIHISQI